MSSHFQASTGDAALRLARHDGACLWIILALGVCAVNYARHYSSSTEALMFIAGALLGQGIIAWAGFELRNQRPAVRNLVWLAALFILILLLAAASVWSGDASHDFEYQGRSRWTGPWGNPNLFGLLMATGVLLAAGLVVQSFRSKGSSEHFSAAKYGLLVLCLLAVALMARGLFQSYSRGAWLGTGCGLAYLIGSGCWFLSSRQNVAGMARARSLAVLKRNWFPALTVAASLTVICFWHFRQTDWHPARRAFSAVNAVDFSWRNRVAAWEGALQITAEHPWFGAGWNQPEPLYEHYYLPTKLNEGLAIEMNDYLLFVATLGLPALFCFGMYLWLSLTWKEKNGPDEAEASRQNSAVPWIISAADHWAFESLQVICRAGAIVLLVGFWFDGGLFKLPTAVTFWILLEMGGLGDHPIRSFAKTSVQRMLVKACKRSPGVTRQVITLHRVLPTTRSANRHIIAEPVARRRSASRARPGTRRSVPTVMCATQGDS